jgi:hypothetical protein
MIIIPSYILEDDKDRPVNNALVEQSRERLAAAEQALKHAEEVRLCAIKAVELAREALILVAAEAAIDRVKVAAENAAIALKGIEDQREECMRHQRRGLNNQRPFGHAIGLSNIRLPHNQACAFRQLIDFQ